MFGADIAQFRPLSFRGRIAFGVSTAALIALLLNVRFGTMAVAAFIGLWGLYVLAWPKFSMDAMFRTSLPWVFPLFALASTLWSMAPDMTMRTAVEWLLTIGIAVLTASALPARGLLASWMLALVPVVVIGAAFGGSQFTETGEIAVTGYFGSKNNFALHISEMFFVCTAVLANAKQGRIVRLVALFGSVVAPLLLWRAKSVGALAVFLPSLLLMCAIIGIGHMRPRLRQIAVAGSLVVALAVAAAVVPAAIGSTDMLLDSVGKSGDLTGRGLLWQRASVLIEQRPALGVGFSAFWLQGNPEAEALWRAEHIESRGGFHFHSFYYQTLIDLGYTGLTIGMAALGLTCMAVLAWGIRKPGPESAFFCAMMLFLFLRSFVEQDLLGGFGLSALILPVAWTYATSRAKRRSFVANRSWMLRRDTTEPRLGQWSAG
jgi:exopolysaccharide production protein ExoQ